MANADGSALPQPLSSFLRPPMCAPSSVRRDASSHLLKTRLTQDAQCLARGKFLQLLSWSVLKIWSKYKRSTTTYPPVQQAYFHCKERISHPHKGSQLQHMYIALLNSTWWMVLKTQISLFQALALTFPTDKSKDRGKISSDFPLGTPGSGTVLNRSEAWSKLLKTLNYSYVLKGHTDFLY